MKTSEVKSDLTIAESKDPHKFDVVKQIRKINDDGSYTVGYEAEDGTFKIESRDVLGNVKGTFGYVDSNGEIKRVSYIANNGTDLKNEDAPPIARINKTSPFSSTRRPLSLQYLSGTSQPTQSPTRSSVIQAIPRKRIISPFINGNSYFTSKASESTPSPRTEPTTTIVYATSVPNVKPMVLIRPTNRAKPTDKVTINQVSKVFISSNKETSTSKPVIEIGNESTGERKVVRGNALRRQLDQEKDEQFEAQQQILYSQSAGEDSAHVYGSGSLNSRPLFTTTHSPRIPSIVIAARQRAAQLQNAINSSQQGKTLSTTEKIYASPPRRQPDTIDVYEHTTEATSENYLTQTPVSAQIPANREETAAADEDTVIYRRTPQNFPDQYLSREQLGRGGPQRYKLPVPNVRIDPNQYLRETTQNPRMFNRRAPKQYAPQQQQESVNEYDQQSFYNNPYRQPYPQSNYYDYPDRPLTTRDFERLLQLLVLKHQQLQSLRYGGGFGGGGYGPNPYFNNGYINPYSGYQQIPRPPIYDPYYGVRDQRQFIEPEGMYQAQSPIPDQSIPYNGQRLALRKKQYNPGYIPNPQSGQYEASEYSGQGQEPPIQKQQEYLPPQVREDLLYRMLMLAIQEQQQQQQNQGSLPSGSTHIERPTKTHKGTRSVQILGEE